MSNKSKFNKISKDIKSIKIQGARNIAKAGLKAYKLIPTQDSKNKLLKLRPTEPLLANILKKTDKLSIEQFNQKLNENQDKINKQVFKLIKDDSVIFTHCHSSTVINALTYAKKKGKKFEVYNTETRPLYQGRKTAKELKNAGIKVTMFVDSAVDIALTHSQKTRDVDLILLGADAILKKGVLNKIGSSMIAQLAKLNKIPIYVLTDSWKYSSKNIKIEQRDFEEVWDTETKIKIKNPAFGLIEKKYIKGIISEFGNLSYKEFLKKV
tara:strand:+ start:14670 stop:15470 length:801 start_codon:yes stop_codon:yes gene_type:complete